MIGMYVLGALVAVSIAYAMYVIACVAIYAFGKEDAFKQGAFARMYLTGKLFQQTYGPTPTFIAPPVGGSFVALLGITVIFLLLAGALIAITIADVLGYANLGKFTYVPAAFGVFLVLILIIFVKAHLKRWGTGEHTLLRTEEKMSILNDKQKLLNRPPLTIESGGFREK